MIKLIYIAIGGAIGALLRHFVSGIPNKFTSGIFPWGTMIVNLFGAFIIGFLWGFSERIIISSNIRSFIFIGVIGAFTTFSTYTLESFNLIRDGEIKLGLANIFVSNVLGLVFVFLGFILSRFILKSNLWR